LVGPIPGLVSQAPDGLGSRSADFPETLSRVERLPLDYLYLQPQLALFLAAKYVFNHIVEGLRGTLSGSLNSIVHANQWGCTADPVRHLVGCFSC